MWSAGSCLAPSAFFSISQGPHIAKHEIKMATNLSKAFMCQTPTSPSKQQHHNWETSLCSRKKEHGPLPIPMNPSGSQCLPGASVLGRLALASSWGGFARRCVCRQMAMGPCEPGLWHKPPPEPGFPVTSLSHNHRPRWSPRGYITPLEMWVAIRGRWGTVLSTPGPSRLERLWVPPENEDCSPIPAFVVATAVPR